MVKTLTKAWGQFAAGTPVSDDPAELSAGAILVNAVRMETLEMDGYFAPVKPGQAAPKPAAAPIPLTPKEP